MKNNIRIFSDASKKHHICTWSFLIDDGVEKKLYSGKCPRWIETSTEAETYSLLMIINYIFSNNLNNENITVYSDCLASVRILDRKKVFITARTKKKLYNLRKMCINLLNEPNLIKFEFIKSHTLESDEKSVMNRVVDISARKLARIEYNKNIHQESNIFRYFLNKINNIFEYRKHLFFNKTNEILIPESSAFFNQIFYISLKRSR